MAINLSTAAPEIRERRLNAVLSYHGTAADLNEKSKRGELKCLGRSYGQCSDCQEGCATSMCSYVRGGAVVAHAPIGCFANDAVRDNAGRAVTAARKLGDFSNATICTNIQEKDTVYGGAEKLRKALREINRRQHPSVIFITSSCASGIVGDDIESVAQELQDELGIPIVPVACEGFKSKIWSTGFDAAFHGILKYIVQPPEKKQPDLVNIFNFEGTDTFTPLLAKLNLRTQYLVPLATKEQLEKISEAACSAQICETLATYIAHGLEQEYGVPEVKAPAPYGINWTDTWLREIAKLTDRTELVEEVIESEHERIRPKLSELKEKLGGKTVYIVAGDAYTHNLANALKDLDLKIIGVAALHHDQRSDSEEVNTLDELVKSAGDIPNFSVCNKQPYQTIKLLKNLHPDFLIIRHQGLTELGYKLGIPTIFEGDANYTVGYDGVVRLGDRLWEAYLTRKFNETIAAHTTLPYTDWWLNEVEDPFYYEKYGKGGRKA
jgi:nitrogenase molybdenum-iron protein alpha chain